MCLLTQRNTTLSDVSSSLRYFLHSPLYVKSLNGILLFYLTRERDEIFDMKWNRIYE